ncbi:MAG: T9SS type A sorting domain-containing protein [Rhizobacter sp.]|nr:T9SS type A sorting domain-containing protein [Ferruginibacter sp.]
MKNSFTILLSILLSVAAGAQTQTPVYLSQTITNAGSNGFYRYLPADYATSTKSYPLIIWVHGAGQLGQGNAADLPKVLEWGLPKIISEGGFPSSFTVDGTGHSFIVISPQFTGWPSGVNVGAMINYVSNNYRVDAERIYLMGISAGGGGIWDYASMSVANSDRVAAMIPFCGTLAPNQTLAGRIAASKMPIWAFHNTNDGTVPVAHSRNWVNYINSYIPAPSPAAKLTEFPVQSNNAVIAHECWSLATLPSYKPQGINIYEWLLQYKRRTTIVNAAPVAKAGNDTSVVLPATVNLNGYASTDADGTIAIYRWRKISGPATHSFSDSTAANTVLGNLSPGTYQFELRVTDNGGATATDNITVNVYAAFSPGAMQRVLIDVGAGSTTGSPTNGLFWNNITDARAGIRVSNAVTTVNLPSGINVQVVNRLDGTYSTSSNGMATGNTTGIVGDYPATATTDLALIHSSATNGTWRIYGMSASKVYTIKFWGSRTNTTAQRTAEIKRADETTWKSYNATNNTNVNNAAVFIISGQTTMDFNIRTRSGSDFSALGVIDISFGDEGPGGPVDPPPNIAPVANAGPGITIQLPADSVLLNGCASSDPEGAALKFKWSKISGPAGFQIVNDTLCQVRIRGLLVGTYQFELAVADTGNLVAKDTVDIVVQSVNQPWPPVYPALCNEPYKIVILGSSTAYGTGASPIDSSWARKLARYITLQNAASTIVNLGLGGYNSYHVMPTGTTPPTNRPFPVDTTHNITKALSLNPKAIIVNLPSNDIAFGVPVAEVKANFEILFAKADSAKVPVWFTTTQPRNNLSPSEKAMQVELKNWILQRFGNKAVDFWTGIATATDSIATPYSAGDGVHVNNAGHHLFFRRLVDEKIWDSICLRKNAAPVAAAGNDVAITGTSANIQLNGNGSYDPEGATLTYSWTIISGGTGGSFNNNAIVNPVFNSGTTGQYSIVLSVTDNNQLSATDTLVIGISEPNILPLANAGLDRLVHLPPNTTTLNGSGSFDADGTIVSYKWRKFSGPSMLFSNDAVANPSVNSLTYGVYSFELLVTDNKGAIAKDTMVLTVNNPPVANAGANGSITLPTNSVVLNGSASTDVDGSISSYSWSKISGGEATISTASSAQTQGSFSAAGAYRFELTVTDNRGSSTKDTVDITVLPAAGVISKTFRVNIFGGTNPYNNAQWNNWNVVSSLTSAKFNYDDGTASNVNAALTAYGLIADNGANYAAAAAASPPAILRYASANTSYRTLTFSGMSNTKTYNLEFYGSRANIGNSSIFQVGNRYDTISTDNNLNDVARFTNVVPDNNGRIVVTISRIGTWNYLSGFVVTENSLASFARTTYTGNETAAAIIPQETAPAANDIFSVHPNPATNFVYINIPQPVAGSYKVIVVNMNGKIVLQKTGVKNYAVYIDRIDVSHLPKGMYSLKLSYSNKTESINVVKL